MILLLLGYSYSLLALLKPELLRLCAQQEARGPAAHAAAALAESARAWLCHPAYMHWSMNIIVSVSTHISTNIEHICVLSCAV